MIAALMAAAALNAQVRPDTLRTTICQPHWSQTYRKSHPVHVHTRKGFVRDHRVPIALGGTSDPSNIQFQSKADGLVKDRLERKLNRAVCRGTVTLKDAQARIAGWKP